jgi:lipopolysaccharide export system protein LptA
MRTLGLAMKRNTLLRAATFVAVAALAGAATAQIGSPNAPLAISADTSELDQAQNTVRFIGRAEAVQGDSRIRAGELRATFGDGMRQVLRIEATGDVYFVTPAQVARGDRAIYAVSEDTLTVTGDVILRQGENVLTGSRLVINTVSGQARMEGGPSEASSARRVRGVFYPGSEN